MDQEIQAVALKSNYKGYSVAWQLNKSFEMNLKLNEDWTVTDKEKESEHSHYYQYFDDVDLHWHLVQNKGTNSTLIKLTPSFDYILFCSGADPYQYFDRCINSIKTSKIINFSHLLIFDNLPNNEKNSILQNILRTPTFLKEYNV